MNHAVLLHGPFQGQGAQDAKMDMLDHHQRTRGTENGQEEKHLMEV